MSSPLKRLECSVMVSTPPSLKKVSSLLNTVLLNFIGWKMMQWMLVHDTVKLVTFYQWVFWSTTNYFATVYICAVINDLLAGSTIFVDVQLGRLLFSLRVVSVSLQDIRFDIDTFCFRQWPTRKRSACRHSRQYPEPWFCSSPRPNSGFTSITMVAISLPFLLRCFVTSAVTDCLFSAVTASLLPFRAAHLPRQRLGAWGHGCENDHVSDQFFFVFITDWKWIRIAMVGQYLGKVRCFGRYSRHAGLNNRGWKNRFLNQAYTARAQIFPMAGCMLVVSLE